jgi:hypothetical protein
MWVDQYKCGKFSTCVAPRPGRNRTVTTPEFINHIHNLILEDRRILAKPLAKKLGISRERVGSIIREHLDVRTFSTKWVPKCLNADQKRQRFQASEQILEISRCDPNDFPSRLVTIDENWLYHYDPRQSNNQCSGFGSQ